MKMSAPSLDDRATPIPVAHPPHATVGSTAAPGGLLSGPAVAGSAVTRIGILAIQGDFDAHARRVEKLGAGAIFIRTPADFDGLAGVILPGGESSTHLKLLDEECLRKPLVEFARNGGAILGTCAGAILLAREVYNPAQASLNLLDISVLRNAYGRQLSSNVCTLLTTLNDAPLEMVFIRAPIIESVGPGVTILAERDGHPILVQQGNILAATFHPELAADLAVHHHFLSLARKAASR
jgi:5'-phosphate synthase pdxT subunit